MRRITRLGIIATAVAAMAFPASAAFAVTTPTVNVGATVKSSLTVTSFTSAINFPAGNPGQTVTSPGESFTVTSNDAAGISVGVQLTTNLIGTDGFDLTSDKGTNNGYIIVSGTVNGTAFPTGGIGNASQVVEVDSSSVGTGSYAVADSWALPIPTDAPAESYSGVASYIIAGN